MSKIDVVWPSERGEDVLQELSLDAAADILHQRGAILLKNAIDPSVCSVLGEQLLPKFKEIPDFRKSMNLFQEEGLAGLK
jgi:hypothetical protein